MISPLTTLFNLRAIRVGCRERNSDSLAWLSFKHAFEDAEVPIADHHGAVDFEVLIDDVGGDLLNDPPGLVHFIVGLLVSFSLQEGFDLLLGEVDHAFAHDEVDASAVVAHCVRAVHVPHRFLKAQC